MIITVNDEISLRQIQMNDSLELFNLVDKNREHLREFLPWVDNTKAEENTIDFIKMCMKNKEEVLDDFQGCVVNNNKIVGMIGFHKIDKANKKTSIGYWLDESHNGRGIMTKSVRALVNYGFNEINLNRIMIECAPENKASWAIPERLNFKCEGIQRQAEWLYDHFVDHRVYSLLKTEFEKNS